MRARKLSFVNFKGGVGKTSLSVNIAASLAHDHNQKVLVVDCDPQSNASIWLMGNPAWRQLKPDSTLLAIYSLNQPSLESIIQRSIVRAPDNQILIKTLDLIPSLYNLREFNEENDMAKKLYFIRFYEAMMNYENQYDFIIFDCPPGLSKSCSSAIFSSDELYIPANPDELSRVGLDFFNQEVLKLKSDTEREAQLLHEYHFPRVQGIIYNGVNRTAKNEAIHVIDQKVENLKKESPLFGKNSKVFTIQVSQSVALPRAANAYRPVTLEPKSRIQEEFTALSQYIISLKKGRRK